MIPVAVYVVGIYVLYAVLTRTFDPFHLSLLAATRCCSCPDRDGRGRRLDAVVPGGAQPQPWVTVVGYELHGHRHNARVLERLAS